MGVLPPPAIARTPNPFPAWPRFVPDPRPLTLRREHCPASRTLAYSRAMPVPAIAQPTRTAAATRT